MKNLRSSLICLAAVLGSYASAEPAPAPAKPTTETIVEAIEPRARDIDIDFPGGPLSSLIALINKDSVGFNVIGEKNDLAIELPPLALRNAEPHSLANALSSLLRSRGYYLENATRGPGSLRAPVYTLRKLGPPEIDPRVAPQFQSFQLAPYLERQSVDDIIGAVRTAWELDPSNARDALRLKFHPPTGILLVSGPMHGINTVQAVLRELRSTSEPNQKSPQKSSASSPVPDKK